MNVFIIRPFGVKEGIDFDRVEAALLQPALASVGIEGGTTGEILKAGNIRHDMFQLLLVADLVLADISIHNANVFYELGIRHALRDKRTILIRGGGDDVPFDLKTDRYLSYDREKPEKALPLLIQALEETLSSEDRDSPVFQLLPELEAQDRRRFLVVPRDFLEAVTQARVKGWRGDLELFAQEVGQLSWEEEGLRLIGRAQFQLQDYQGARATWERVRTMDGNDLEANLLLATVYQRLGELILSDQAIERVLAHKGARTEDLAEAYALRGRNAKTRWQQEWEQIPDSARLSMALRSPFLPQAIEDYSRGFLQQLNHYYSGINGLALLVILTEIADQLPTVWQACFDDDEEAAHALKHAHSQCATLQGAVTLSLEAEQQRLQREGREDVWLALTLADLRCLTLQRPERVAQAYRQALCDIDPFALGSATRQLRLLEMLQVRRENVQAALRDIEALLPTDEQENKAPIHVLLFTGHMIDKPEREQPRFPAELEDLARQKIWKQVSGEIKAAPGPVIGLAGCACGGDILFHEVCAELGVKSRILLAMPREQYIVASVQHGGPGWVERFNRLCAQLDTRVLSADGKMPAWLRKKCDYTIWQRNNLWLLYNGIGISGGEHLSLIALWDGQSGDGPGGTEDMVAQAKARGAKTTIIATKKLLKEHTESQPNGKGGS